VSETARDTSDWLDMQRKYWETWSELGRRTLGAESAPANPWMGTLDHWWEAMSPALPNDLTRDFMARLMDQGKALYGITESFTKGLTGADTTTTQAWDVFAKSIQDLQNAFTSGQPEAEETVRRLMAFWEMPLDNWQRMMSSLSPVPGDLLRNMPHDQVKHNVNRILSAPGLGYTREEQARYQDLIRRSLDYQTALREYSGFFAQLGAKALEQMRRLVQSRAEEGKTIDSARTLYDSWIGCCEQVYAEEVSTPEYARIHGHLVNAEMALKQRLSTMVDEILGAMNMPTRSELRTLQDRLQESRRESMRQRQELNSLKRQVQALSAAPKTRSAAAKAAPASSTTPKPTPRRKSTAKSTAGN
jgi:class III poly(R)-hydroxyalkanoic acid synthase PhaE subunit